MRLGGGNDLALRIHHPAVAAVVMPVAVGSHAVTAHHVRLVLNCTRYQQRLPVQGARCRPVGNIQRQVVIVAVARPHREAQVVADQRQNTPAAPLEHHALVTRFIVMMLIRHAEQVAFIVKMHFPFRLHQQEAVHRPAIRLQGGAPGDQRVGLLRFGMHPGHHLILRH